ncbi:hypothetical protein ACPUCW_004821 [Escherichia coli]|nr:hypothetical protein [Escherichia coli]EEV9294983.1 hypothetical protein [Escherichia coli]EEV9962948.1 hypothetical protein [Escherichia coli]EEV9981792.1 hypothetical protein [Escherichia coli]EEW7842675.1 hypothetical protein [Escherichia coli]EGE7005925.1 hypothetical protein [Escherichia coli]
MSIIHFARHGEKSEYMEEKNIARITDSGAQRVRRRERKAPFRFSIGNNH